MEKKMEELEAENARLREQLDALQAKYDALDATTTKKIQDLIDENEILAEANRIFMENEATFKRLNGSLNENPDSSMTTLMQVPDELLLPGNGIKTCEIAVMEDVHSFGNLLCVAAHPTRSEVVLTGGVDKHICAHDWQHTRSLCRFQASAPVLDLAFNPNPQCADYFVTAFMDAKHGLYRLGHIDDVWKIDEICNFHDHSRHGSLKVAWSTTGELFATGSSDKSLNIYRCKNLNAADDQELSACEKIKSFYFNGTVEAIAFIPASSPEDTDKYEARNGLLAVAVRDDCYLHYIDCSTFEKERINMNQDGIEHVSYTIMDLQVSPTGKYILAATDTHRNFIFAIKRNTILRNFYGHKAGPYSQPKAAWHPSEKYVISNTEDSGSIFVWCIASEQVIDTIIAHEKLVRDLVTFASTSQYLVTVSYDKKLKVWETTVTDRVLTS